MRLLYLVITNFIFLLSLNYQLSSQSICDTDVFLLTSEYDSLYEVIPHSKDAATVSFLDRYNFEDDGGYSILIASVDNDSIRYSLVKDPKILAAIQKKYNLVEISKRECDSKGDSYFLLLKNKKIVEIRSIDIECNSIETECGIIDFEPEILALSEFKNSFFKNHLFDFSKDELKRKINLFEKDNSTLFYGLSKEKFIGIAEVRFNDLEMEVSKIYEDEFYFGLLKDIMLDRNKINFIELKDKLNFQDRNVIVEWMIYNKLGSSQYEIVDWKRSNENAKDFILKIRYYNKDWLYADKYRVDEEYIYSLLQFKVLD